MDAADKKKTGPWPPKKRLIAVGLPVAVALFIVIRSVSWHGASELFNEGVSIEFRPAKWRLPPDLAKLDAFVVDATTNGQLVLVKFGDYPDRELAVISTKTGTVLARRKKMRESARFLGESRAVLVAPDGRTHVVGAQDLTTRFVLPTSPSALGIAVSSDGTRLAYLRDRAREGELEIWALAEGETAPLWRGRCPSGPVQLAFEEDSHHVLVHGLVKYPESDWILWSSRTGENRTTPLGPTLLVENGRYLIVCDRDEYGRARLNVIRTTDLGVEYELPLDGFCADLSASRRGERIAFLSVRSKRWIVWEPETDTRRSFEMSDEQTRFVSFMVFLQEGRHMIWATRTVSHWQTADLPVPGNSEAQ